MEHTNEQIIEQLKLIGATNGRIFDQQCGACWEAINRSIEALESRPKGKWIESNPKNSDLCRLVKCSNCDDTFIVNINVPLELWRKKNRNYCGRCGADMRGEE